MTVLDDKNNRIAKLENLLSEAITALVLTRDYVGPDKLPEITGWSWYDISKKIALEIPQSKGFNDFACRIECCPECNSNTGIKLPRDHSAYCEDCGWPDGIF